MKFDIITLFPEAFNFTYSIIGRAIESNLVEINIHNLRNYGLGPRQTVDDRPFGGGAGMVMMFEPIYRLLKDLKVYPNRDKSTKVILTSAKGELWNQPKAKRFSEEINRIIIICGHYEGVDNRVAEELVDEEISIGNYVLSGGELAASIMIDSVSRLVPGVLGNPESLEEESHNEVENLEYPQYTRPAEFQTEEGKQLKVPDILLSGNHAEIAKWRKSSAN